MTSLFNVFDWSRPLPPPFSSLKWLVFPFSTMPFLREVQGPLLGRRPSAEIGAFLTPLSQSGVPLKVRVRLPGRVLLKRVFQFRFLYLLHPRGRFLATFFFSRGGPPLVPFAETRGLLPCRTLKSPSN